MEDGYLKAANKKSILMSDNRIVESIEQEEYMTRQRSQRAGTGGNRPKAVIEWACKPEYEHCGQTAPVVFCGMSPVTEDRI